MIFAEWMPPANPDPHYWEFSTPSVWDLGSSTTNRTAASNCREQLAFNRDEIVHLQYITTKRLNWGGTANNERLSELNLITCHNGERRRWPLLRSNNSTRAFDRLLEPLLRETDLPVVRVLDEWLGWRVTETPYGPANPTSGQANTEIRPILATRPDPLLAISVSRSAREEALWERRFRCSGGSKRSFLRAFGRDSGSLRLSRTLLGAAPTTKNRRPSQKARCKRRRCTSRSSITLNAIRGAGTSASARNR